VRIATQIAEPSEKENTRKVRVPSEKIPHRRQILISEKKKRREGCKERRRIGGEETKKRGLGREDRYG